MLRLLWARIKKAGRVHLRLMDAGGIGTVGRLYFTIWNLEACRMSPSNNFQASKKSPIIKSMNSVLLESFDISKGYWPWASASAVWEKNAGAAIMDEVQPNWSSSMPVVSKTLVEWIQWGLCLEMSLDLCKPAKQFSDSTKTNPRTILSLFIFIFFKLLQVFRNVHPKNKPHQQWYTLEEVYMKSGQLLSYKKKPDQLRTALASEEGDENFISI